jgi:DNA-binding GntR family transcriptional regulator
MIRLTSSHPIERDEARGEGEQPVAGRGSRNNGSPRELRERILSGAHGQGFRVVIDPLCAEFDASALFVHDAIRRLGAEGLDVYRPHAGAHVTPAEADALRGGISVPAVLECHAIRLAAPCLRRDAAGRLQATNDAMATVLERLDIREAEHSDHMFDALLDDYVHSRACAVAWAAPRRRACAQSLKAALRGSRSTAGSVTLIVRSAAPPRIDAAERAFKLAHIESIRAY